MGTPRKCSHNGQPSTPGGPRSETLVGGPDLRFYHRADCVMAADREWSAATSGEHDQAGRTPCGMCRP
jgi:hypothetical protein